MTVDLMAQEMGLKFSDCVTMNVSEVSMPILGNEG